MGAALAVVIAADSWYWTTHGYQDGFLLVLIVTLAFARQERESSRLAGILACCAALLKQEGLIFALIVWPIAAAGRRLRAAET